ncbi:hypothetical protein SNOG_03393 [Parastagonospora nodorum SN15]|uniref:Uncharacterized protein n=1 Tax=Phaeosphaeria nodorum (strain SN15 / ATCC MYA-4574 / FGSC 10173) TaxID=321614 RepID=Q0UXX1_PHANO|nr:hypothetical protein SNOG_03393 [Parastagonospora nodorum SN15]EAT88598.1 hypothetical protein SNOG_03393 [Parastagonospora nodorum SN15]
MANQPATSVTLGQHFSKKNVGRRTDKCQVSPLVGYALYQPCLSWAREIRKQQGITEAYLSHKSFTLLESGNDTPAQSQGVRPMNDDSEPECYTDTTTSTTKPEKFHVDTESLKLVLKPDLAQCWEDMASRDQIGSLHKGTAGGQDTASCDLGI